MYEPKHVIARFEIVTPMFLGGADQEARTIRSASIKGELAFWWRALHFSRYVAQNQTLRSAMDAMHADEQFLFGSTERQGTFLLSVGNCRTKTLRKGKVLTKYGEQADPRAEGVEQSHPDLVGPGSRYLGYGILSSFTQREASDGQKHHRNFKSYAGQLLRSCFAPGGTFDVRIAFGPHLLRSGGKSRDEEERLAKLQNELIDAVKILGQLGGLGSRKRRGWGSVALRSLEGRGGVDVEFEPANLIKEYQNNLRNLVLPGASNGTQYPLTAFAKETELRIWDDSGWRLEPSTDGTGLFKSPMDAIEAMGKAFQVYRGWGRGAHVAGEPRKENFKPDHDWFKSGQRHWDNRNGHGIDGRSVPERASFGLPHNYFGTDNADRRVKLNVDPAGDSNRRGSPLFFHVQPLGGGYLPVAEFFDNQFLPEGTSKNASQTRFEPIECSITVGP